MRRGRVGKDMRRVRQEARRESTGAPLTLILPSPGIWGEQPGLTLMPASTDLWAQVRWIGGINVRGAGRQIPVRRDGRYKNGRADQVRRPAAREAGWESGTHVVRGKEEG